MNLSNSPTYHATGLLGCPQDTHLTFYGPAPKRFKPGGLAGGLSAGFEDVGKSATKGAAAATGVITTAGSIATAAGTIGATGIASAAATIGSVVPVIGTAIGLVIGAAVGAVIAKVGGVTQKRFINRYFEVKNVLNDAGYTFPNHDKLITNLKIRKTQVKDNKQKGSYAPEFARLMQYVITRLDYNNPGLGEYWATNFPFEMANKGNIKGDSIAKLKQLTKMFPPGTYRGQQPFVADTSGQLLNSIANSGTQTVNADGVIVINNEPSVLPQQTYELASIIDQDERNQETDQAGIGPAVGIGIGVIVLIALLSSSSKNA